MAASGFPRSDDLPPDAATGYVEVDGVVRTNVLHLPVRGVGDGGAYSTVADLHRFWTALVTGRVLPKDVVAEMVRPRSTADPEGGLPARRYGLGFWLHPVSDAVMLEGYDAGVSCVSVHVPSQELTYTVLSNESEGAWPLAGALRDLLAPWS
jgi:CubicO group peptidase (beta-lactamase class C family)